MLLLKLTLAIIASVTLIMGVCESDDDENEQTDEARALEVAALFAGDRLEDIPYTDENYDCIIFVAIQPTAPANPLRDVGGRCLWAVEPKGDTWEVTFRETWFCSDWNAELEGFPPCDGLTGFHEWKYFVDLVTREVNLLEDSGQFAPDMQVQ